MNIFGKFNKPFSLPVVGSLIIYRSGYPSKRDAKKLIRFLLGSNLEHLVDSEGCSIKSPDVEREIERLLHDLDNANRCCSVRQYLLEKRFNKVMNKIGSKETIYNFKIKSVLLPEVSPRLYHTLTSNILRRKRNELYSIAPECPECDWDFNGNFKGIAVEATGAPGGSLVCRQCDVVLLTLDEEEAMNEIEKIYRKGSTTKAPEEEKEEEGFSNF